ncbi:hypothetical protein RFI_19931 [Reticulomyxa filosa]|uniref:Uncharacterized protein n=1 Tax=Reticulomyxa filosa TaxID=46433 RepID=X6MTW1_RETFI|nr:hypothetical protein RFI_19931 [Reticulomyxa filosa]|eukprot:ETO17388.1 hypothetical protein RFI_19931 [Reticulomyxa filosa]
METVTMPLIISENLLQINVLGKKPTSLMRIQVQNCFGYHISWQTHALFELPDHFIFDIILFRIMGILLSYTIIIIVQSKIFFFHYRNKCILCLKNLELKNGFFSNFLHWAAANPQIFVKILNTVCNPPNNINHSFFFGKIPVVFKKLFCKTSTLSHFLIYLVPSLSNLCVLFIPSRLFYCSQKKKKRKGKDREKMHNKKQQKTNTKRGSETVPISPNNVSPLSEGKKKQTKKLEGPKQNPTNNRDKQKFLQRPTSKGKNIDLLTFKVCVKRKKEREEKKKKKRKKEKSTQDKSKQAKKKPTI